MPMRLETYGACLPCNRRHQMQDGMLSVGHRICLPFLVFHSPSLLMVLHWATLADSVVLVHSRGSSLFKETPASKPILGYLHAFFHAKIAWPLYYGLLL